MTDGRTDGQTDERTLVVVESLSRLKKEEITYFSILFLIISEWFLPKTPGWKLMGCIEQMGIWQQFRVWGFEDSKFALFYFLSSRFDIEQNKMDNFNKTTNVHNCTGLIKLFFRYNWDTMHLKFYIFEQLFLENCLSLSYMNL